MKVTFRNIGPVAKAELDLTKRLILLCGPNNTGKTYISYCLYGLHRLREMSRIPLNASIQSFLEADVDGIIRFEATALAKALRSTLKNYFERDFKESLSSLFAVGDEALDKFFGDTELSLVMPTENKILAYITDRDFTTSYSYKNGITVLVGKESGDTEFRMNVLAQKNQGIVGQERLYTRVPFEAIIKDIATSFLPNAFIAPVERNSIFTFSRELAMKRNDLVDEMLRLREGGKKKATDPLDLFSRRAMRYPMPIRDGLEIAEDLATISKNVSDYAHLADQLESGLLGGRVAVSKEGSVEYSPGKSKSLKIPIQLTASVVKSLSGLVIFFRHVAQKGDLIIIDEPELNLHPDAQIGFARFMAQLLDEGFQLAITTHSDYIIRELNNLMMVNSLRKKEAAVPGPYDEQGLIGIPPEQVGAFLFTPAAKSGRTKAKGIEVIPLPVDETGFAVDTMDAITVSLNNVSQELYFELLNAEEEEDEEA